MNTKRIKRLLVGILSAIALPTFGGDAARAADLPASTRGRRDFGGVDPVDFQGVHDGKGHGKFGIAVVSPPLDAVGNSVRAQKAIADISNALDGNPYAIKPRK